MDVVPVKHGTLDHMLNLVIWFYLSVTAIDLRWHGVQWCIFDIFVWIGLCNQLKLYRLPIYPVK